MTQFLEGLTPPPSAQFNKGEQSREGGGGGSNYVIVQFLNLFDIFIWFGASQFTKLVVIT